MQSPTVPLTVTQKLRLAAVCLPFPFFVAATAFFYGYWVDFASQVTGKPAGKGWLFAAFMALVIAVTGYRALQAVRDLLSGVAVVTEDRLVRIWRSRRYWRAQFEQLGRIRIVRWSGATPGELHRVIYSPAARIVWEVEALAPRS